MPEESVNIAKSRSDTRPVRLIRHADWKADEPAFTASNPEDCPWADTGTVVTPAILRRQIEPWLTALFQSEHLSLLAGSGLPNAVHHLVSGETCPWMTSATWGDETEAVSQDASATAVRAGRKDPNLEDQLRSAGELLRGLEILNRTDAGLAVRVETLRGKIEDSIAGLASSVLAAEANILRGEEARRELAFNYLVSFLMSFASRSGTRDRLHVFTTNYDRIIEAGAELAGMHLLDRFIGTLAPVFRASRLEVDLHYNPPGIRGEPRYLEGVARFTKLHGSLDWHQDGGTIRRLAVPFGAMDLGPFVKAAGSTEGRFSELMIFPNAAKDRETAEYPYVDLFRDLAAATCRPNHTLVTYGYSFGDEHINRVIEDMLTIPSTHLVVISFSDPLGRVMSTYERLGRHAQVSLLVGDHLGDFKALVDNYLPKPAIDRTTFRMADLLKSRWTSGPARSGSDEGAPSAQEGQSEVEKQAK